jgi:hypothetical protein
LFARGVGIEMVVNFFSSFSFAISYHLTIYSYISLYLIICN